MSVNDDESNEFIIINENTNTNSHQDTNELEEANKDDQNEHADEINLVSTDDDADEDDDEEVEEEEDADDDEEEETQSEETQMDANHVDARDIYTQSTEVSRSRIGKEFQALPVSLEDNPNDRSKVQTKETLVWMPSDKLADKELTDFLNTACYKHTFNIEQALALLFWNDYDMKKTLNDLNKYLPKPNNWTQEEKILFEQVFLFHGKNFSKIRQVLPDKKQSDLVNYYYMWKKSRANTSSIDHQQLNNKSAMNNGNGSDDTLENGSRDESEDGNEDDSIGKICINCDLITNDLQSTPRGLLCNVCYNYWKQTGVMKPDSHAIAIAGVNGKHENSLAQANETNGNSVSQCENSAQKTKSTKTFHKSLRKLPKGIYLNCEELLSLTKVENCSQIFEKLGVELRSKKEELQRNKQIIFDWLIKLAQSDVLEVAIDSELLQLEEETLPKPGWTQHEIELVLQAFSKYGDNFTAISEVIGSKTEGSIRAFYEYNKDFLNIEKFNGTDMNSKEIKAKASSLIDHITSKASKFETIKAVDLKKTSNEQVEDKYVARLDNENVLYIEKEEDEAKRANKSFLDPKPPVTSSLIDENEDVIFYSNDSN